MLLLKTWSYIRVFIMQKSINLYEKILGYSYILSFDSLLYNCYTQIKGVTKLMKSTIEIFEKAINNVLDEAVKKDKKYQRLNRRTRKKIGEIDKIELNKEE